VRADGDRISNDELLRLEVDVLIPAAVGNVLDKDNAKQAAARLIVEAANGPTTPEADTVFREAGLTVVPDILANSGGVIASYVEWRQAKSASLTDAQETYAAVESRIDAAFEQMWACAERDDVALRTACQIVALEEIIRSMRDRVWI
jgi:glutamate dehydrogenase (NAD(P)+)